MNRDGHLALAGLTTAVVTYQLDLPLWQRVGASVVALATASAPDVDNTRWWQEVRQRVPVHVVRRALNHRGLTHWWGVPLGMYLSQDDPSWVLLGLVLGYASHLVADALFGKTGVPVLPWGWHLGLRLKMGGGLERGVAVGATIYTPLVLALGPHAVARVGGAVAVFLP